MTRIFFSAQGQRIRLGESVQKNPLYYWGKLPQRSRQYFPHAEINAKYLRTLEKLADQFKLKSMLFGQRGL